MGRVTSAPSACCRAGAHGQGHMDRGVRWADLWPCSQVGWCLWFGVQRVQPVPALGNPCHILSLVAQASASQSAVGSSEETWPKPAQQQRPEPFLVGGRCGLRSAAPSCCPVGAWLRMVPVHGEVEPAQGTLVPSLESTLPNTDPGSGLLTSRGQ